MTIMTRKSTIGKIDERKIGGRLASLHLTQILPGILNLLDGTQVPLLPLTLKMGIIQGLMMDHGDQNICHP